MSIQLKISASGLSVNATLKDEALPELISLMQRLRDESVATQVDAQSDSSSVSSGGNIPQSVNQAREQFVSHGAGEVLNLLQWEGYSDKILLLGAWHEAHANDQEPWRLSDVQAAFLRAREKPPGNFARDLNKAVRSGWIHAVTPRTYQVTRSGWNRIAAALGRQSGPEDEKM
jgi:hypothetical protein